MPTLAEIVLEAAKKATFAYNGTCSANGTTTTLIDAVLRDQGVTTRFSEGTWIKLPAASAADMIRRVNEDGFTTGSGTLTWTRVLSTANAVLSGVAYEVYSVLPPAAQAGAPYDWVQAVNEGLQAMYKTDRIVLGRGDKSGKARNIFSFHQTETTLIALIAVAGGSGATITAPSGWTLITSVDSGTDIKLAAYRKRALATDGIEFEFTLDSSRVAAAVILPLVDANPTAPVRGSGTQDNGSSATATAPSVSSEDDDLILRIFGAVGSMVFTPASGLIEVADAVSDDGAAQMGLAVAYVDSSGSTATVGQAAINTGMTLVIKPSDDDHEVAVGTPRIANNGSGATKVSIPRPNVLHDDWNPNEDALRRVLIRTYDSDGNYVDKDADEMGRFTERWMDGSKLHVRVYPQPVSNEYVVAELDRPYPSLVADDDVTDCPMEWAFKAAIWKVYQKLNSTPATLGKYKGEAQAAFEDWYMAYVPPSPFVRL